jgi:TetR/AcrR family transcriptional regulator, lmrAB and yxaGH operons repressor
MSDTRHRFLTTTASLFQLQGFNATSIKQITDAAEATTGSLYHFFPGGKDQLAAEVIATAGAQYLEMFQLIAAVPGLGADEAMTLLFNGAATTLEQSDYVDACPIFTVALEVASANDPLRIACDRVFSSWADTAVTIFRQAGVAPDRAAALASTVVAALGGAFVLARTAKDANLMRGIGREITTLVRQAIVDAAPAGPDHGDGEA